MLEVMISFVAGMVFGAIGLLFFLALVIAGDTRHWRDR